MNNLLESLAWKLFEPLFHFNETFLLFLQESSEHSEVSVFELLRCLDFLDSQVEFDQRSFQLLKFFDFFEELAKRLHDFALAEVDSWSLMPRSWMSWRDRRLRAWIILSFTFKNFFYEDGSAFEKSLHFEYFDSSDTSINTKE